MPEALQDIAEELRSLPARADSIAERLESAGILLLAAIDAGAWSDRVAFVKMVQQRAEKIPGNVPNFSGEISAWVEATNRLAGRQRKTPDPGATFAEDCEMVARALEGQGDDSVAETMIDVRTPRPGGGYLSHKELASAGGIPRDRVEALRKALDRWRQNNFDGWIENHDRGPRDPRYLYDFVAVGSVIESVRRTSGEKKVVR